MNKSTVLKVLVKLVLSTIKLRFLNLRIKRRSCLCVRMLFRWREMFLSSDLVNFSNVVSISSEAKYTSFPQLYHDLFKLKHHDMEILCSF